MANVMAPFGFRPVRHVDGTPYTGSHVLFLVDSGDGTAIGVGDLVKMAGASGVAGQVVHGMDVEGMPTAILATAGTAGQDLLGPVIGFLVNQDNLMQNSRAASQSRVAMVCVDRSVIYEVQEDADTTPIPSTAIGNTVPYTTTAFNATTGISKMALDSSAVNTTNTFPVKIVGLTKKIGNAFNTGGSLVDAATFDVMLNTGFLMDNIAGV